MAVASNPVPESGMTPRQVVAAVDAVMRGPMVWGQSDCCCCASEVFRRLWGVAPLPWGSDGGKASALRELRRRGGDLGLVVATEAERAGLVIARAHPGALALVHTAGPIPVMPAICIEPGQWAGRTETGWGVVQAAILNWGVECRS